ncbi:MAG: hypothetical protein AAF485_02570 [Chloroflexota bacterium]
MQLEKSMLEAYKNRWQAVADRENEEQKKIPFVDRWKKLNSIIRIAQTLGLDRQPNEQQIDVVRQRWNELKDRQMSGLESLQP